MKLSECEEASAALARQHARIIGLRDQRRNAAAIIVAIDAGEGIYAATGSGYTAADFHAGALPVVRQAYVQTIQLIECDLAAMGVEIDELPLVDLAEDAEDTAFVTGLFATEAPVGEGVQIDACGADAPAQSMAQPEALS